MLSIKDILKKAYIPLTTLGLYLHPSPSYSQSTNPYAPLENRTEFVQAIDSFQKHRIQQGDFAGLENHIVSKSNINEYLNFITTNSPHIQKIAKKIPKNGSNLQKATAIYNALRKIMQYEQDDFEKLAFINSKNLPNEDKKLYEKIIKPTIDKKIPGMQTIDETFKYKKGDCDELSVQLVSALKAAGIEAYLTLVESKENKGHLIVYFDTGFKRKNSPNTKTNKDPGYREEIFGYIDPSYYQEYTFTENMQFCIQYADKENYPVRTMIE